MLATMAPPTPPSRARMMWWGGTRRCARCGGGHLFTRYFTMVDDCPRCGLHFEREQGYWAGALAINIGVTGAVFVVVFVTALVLTVPDVPVAPLLAILIPLMILTPILYYPFSKTVWVALDRALLQHLDPRAARRTDASAPDADSGTETLSVARYSGVPRSMRNVSTPSVKSHVASPMMAKSWKSRLAWSTKR